jgi:hypothetical protein
MIAVFFVFLFISTQDTAYSDFSLYNQTRSVFYQTRAQVNGLFGDRYLQNLFFIPYLLLLINYAFYPFYYFGTLKKKMADNRRIRKQFFPFYFVFVVSSMLIGLVRLFSFDRSSFQIFIGFQESIALLTLFLIFASLTFLKENITVRIKYFSLVLLASIIIFLFWLPIIACILLATLCFVFSVFAFKTGFDLPGFGFFILFLGLSFDSINFIYKGIPIGSPGIGLFGFYFAFLLHQFCSLFDKLVNTSLSNARLEQEILRRERQLEAQKKIAEKNEKELSKLEQLILATNALYEKALLLDEDYLPDLLEHAKTLVPEADFASLFLLENGTCVSSFTIGHDFEKLKNNPEAYKFVTYLRNLPSTKIFDANVFLAGINDDIKLLIPVETYLSYSEATKPVKETLVSEISGRGVTYGYLCLDISKNSEKSFSTTSFRVLGVLGSIASILLNSSKTNR